MNSQHFPVYILLLLLAGAVIIPIIEKRKIIIVFTILPITWLLSLATFFRVYSTGGYSYFFGGWSRKIGIEFVIDEFSSLMVLFIITMASLIMIYAIRDLSHEIQANQISNYYTLIFLALFSMLGIVMTNDMFNLYVFMEILSIMSCSIISIKRKKGNYIAALRYLILNSIASLSVLMGIALLYMVTGYLNMTQLSHEIGQMWNIYPINVLVAVGFMFSGFAIKAAVFPLHIWLPDAHSTAPTPSSAFLSGLVVKVYVVAFIKVLFTVLGISIAVDMGITDVVTIFAVVGIIMGSMFAIGQRDIKRMLAYSSVAQLGYIFLGIGLATDLGISAAIFHIFSHGLMKIALFLSAGAIIYKKGKRDIRELAGIGYEMPLTMFTFSVAALGMIGIPGISGFMSKLYISFAVLDAEKPLFIAVILLSSFLNAIYYLPIITSVYLKEDKERPNVMVADNIPNTMMLPMLVIAFTCIIIGFYPSLIMDFIEKAVPVILGR